MASLKDSLDCCRLCLTTEEDDKVYESLFSPEGNYIEKIAGICGIRITPSEKNIEMKICSSCISDLNSASSFRLQVLDACDYFVVMEGMIREVDSRINDSSAPSGSTEVKNDTNNKLTKPNPPKPQVEQEAEAMPPVPAIPSAKPLKEPAKKEIREAESTKRDSAPMSSSSKRIRKATTRLLECEEPEIRKLKSMLNLNSSRNYETAGKVIEPPIISSSIQTESQLMTKIPIFQCDNCTRSFSSLLGLKKHLDEHSSVNSLLCFFCPLKFRGKSERLNHMQVEHIKKLSKLYAGDPL